MHDSNSQVLSHTSGLLEVEDTDVLCIPSEYFQDILPSLLQWVEKGDRYVLILWQSASFDSFIDISPRIRSFVLHDPIEESFKQIAWEYVFLRIKLWSPSPWKHKDLFEHTLLGVHLVASDYQDFGSKVRSNVCINTKAQDKHYSLDALKGSMKGIPAIICGAGPTLSENMEQLCQMRSSALILAGGAAIKALSSRSVFFHAAAGIDPDPDYERFVESSAFETPFFYQDRFSSEILSMIHSQKIRLPSTSEYPFEEWLKQEMGSQQSPFDGGWTVATLMTSLATHLGCSPIVFVGMDFGYKDKMYTEELTATDHSDEGAILMQGQIKTKSDWIMASHWIEQWIKTHPEARFINTSSISCFAGSESASLHSVQKELSKSYDVKGDLHSALEEAKIKRSLDRASLAFEELDESVCRTKDLLASMVKLFESYYPEDPTSKGEFILAEYDLYDELCYKVVIEPVWRVWKHVFARIEDLPIDRRRLHEILFFQKIINAHKS